MAYREIKLAYWNCTVLWADPDFFLGEVRGIIMFGGGGWLGGVEDLFSAGDVTVNLMELVRFCLVQGESTNLDPI